MEREANYKHMLARRQNQDWFGLPIVRKVGALKKARYRMSKAMRHRSAKAEIKAFDDAAAKNADMDYSNRIVSESLMYVPPVKTQSWEQQFHEAEALRVVSEWEWLRELATGKKYWLNIKRMRSENLCLMNLSHGKTSYTISQYTCSGSNIDDIQYPIIKSLKQ